MSKRIALFVPMLALTLLGLAGNASAVQRPLQRTLLGSVEAVDSSRHRIKVRDAANHSESHWISLPSRAVIVGASGQSISSETIKVGDTLRVSYRSHWSANRQATRVAVK